MTIDLSNRISQNGSRLPTSDHSRPGLGSESPPSKVEPPVPEEKEEQSQSARPEQTSRTSPQDSPPRQSRPQSNRSTGQQQEANNRGADRTPEQSEQTGESNNSGRSSRPPAGGRISIISPENGNNNSAPRVEEGGQSDRESPENTSSQPETARQAEGQKKSQGPRNLSPEERRKLRKLQRIDRKVRAHEQAHVAAGGAYVKGGPNYNYTYGPNGKRYAVGGEVSLDTGKARTPEKTLQKMQQVRRAALAPAEPSSQDYSVARKAAQKATKARMKLAKKSRKDNQGETGDQQQNSPAGQNKSPRRSTRPEQNTIGQKKQPQFQEQAGERSRESEPVIVGRQQEPAPGNEAKNNLVGMYNRQGNSAGIAGGINSQSGGAVLGNRLNLRG